MYNLAFLVNSLRATKKDEDIAKQKRIEVEEKIAALVETKEVGQKTVTLEDGTKVTVKRGFNYTADIEAIRKVFPPETSFPVPVKTETKHTLDVKGYEWYKERSMLSDHPIHQGFFAKISKHVTVTLKKVAITIKESTP